MREIRERTNNGFKNGSFENLIQTLNYPLKTVSIFYEQNQFLSYGL